MRRLLLVLLSAALLALPLSGCGKKGPPKPPSDEQNTYPRQYPNA